MNQREVINEIKRTKWELQQRFDPELLVRLYKLIDELGLPKDEIPNRKTGNVNGECDLEGIV